MCDCMKKMNEYLESHNGRIATGLQVTADMSLKERYLVATEKIDKAKRKPIPNVVMGYCPFCGTRFE